MKASVSVSRKEYIINMQETIEDTVGVEVARDQVEDVIIVGLSK